MVKTARKENNIITKNGGIIESLNVLSRYYSGRKAKNTRKKLLGIGLEKIAKIENIWKNELNQAKKLQKKSIDELREIARLRGIKNREKLRREDLIISLLKSESSALENNFNNNTDDDDTYGDKIRGKISGIRMIHSRLGNVVTKNDRKKITKELYETKKKKNLSDKEKEKIYDRLVELVNTVNKRIQISWPW